MLSSPSRHGRWRIVLCLLSACAPQIQTATSKGPPATLVMSTTSLYDELSTLPKSGNDSLAAFYTHVGSLSFSQLYEEQLGIAPDATVLLDGGSLGNPHASLVAAASAFKVANRMYPSVSAYWQASADNAGPLNSLTQYKSMLKAALPSGAALALTGKDPPGCKEAFFGITGQLLWFLATRGTTQPNAEASGPTQQATQSNEQATRPNHQAMAARQNYVQQHLVVVPNVGQNQAVSTEDTTGEASSSKDQNCSGEDQPCTSSVGTSTHPDLDDSMHGPTTIRYLPGTGWESDSTEYDTSDLDEECGFTPGFARRQRP